jgi:hypothetical protein
VAVELLRLKVQSGKAKYSDRIHEGGSWVVDCCFFMTGSRCFTALVSYSFSYAGLCNRQAKASRKHEAKRTGERQVLFYFAGLFDNNCLFK